VNLSKQSELSEQSAWLNNIISIFYISRNFVHFVYFVHCSLVVGINSEELVMKIGIAGNQPLTLSGLKV
jgi:hypothetical protein